ncbi:unnamed protein product [Lupinus luteus]|uniref:Uncharacterized protein n=1 Tax=Lupinus luteus TaxID=3873 RepID=A0AAV1Y3E7_LUPLU
MAVKELLTYARNLLEFSSFKVFRKLSSSPHYLNDKHFRRLTFDIMLAWEAPNIYSEEENPSFSKGESGDKDEEGSLFYSTSTSMTLQLRYSEGCSIENDGCYFGPHKDENTSNDKFVKRP